MNKSQRTPLGVMVCFSVCMSVLIYLFVVAGRQSSAASWVYGSFLFILFVGMTHTRRISIYRRIFQVSIALLFLVSLIGNTIASYGGLRVNADAIRHATLPFSEFLIPLLIIPFALTRTVHFPSPIMGSFVSVLGLCLVWAMATLTIGRGWCSWVCPYGGIEDGMSRLSGKTRLSLLSRNETLRSFHFGFLFFVVLVSAALLSPVYEQWFNPFRGFSGFLPTAGLPGLLAMAVSLLLFISLVIVLPFLTRKRVQCSVLCPLGAFQTLLHAVGSFAIRIDTDKCNQCLKCAEACQFCAIDSSTITDRKGQPEMSCARCGECVDACPQKAISYEFAFLKKGCPRPVAVSGWGKALSACLDPELVFAFTAFSFGVFVSSGFGPDALARIFALVSGGLK